jgi:hypothetical protein
MSDPRISELLTRLHRELEQSGRFSEAERERLRALAAAIEALPGVRDAGARERHQSVLARLQEAVVHFEATHPDLTVTLASVSQALSDMGI